MGILWLIGLWIIRVPWAPLWAALAALLQIVPHFGPILGLLGPVLASALRWKDWRHPLYVLALYGVIVVVDGLVLQPYIMRRVAKVRMWASILVPLVLGFVIPFWGFLLAPPLLAVVYAFKTTNISLVKSGGCGNHPPYGYPSIVRTVFHVKHCSVLFVRIIMYIYNRPLP